MPGKDDMQVSFPDLPYEEDPDDAPKADPNKALLDQIAALNREVGELKRVPQAMAQDFTIAQRPNLNTKPDLKGLPDPVLEPEAYSTQLANRITTADENRRRISEWEQEQQRKANGRTEALWNDFSTAYPEHAKKRKAVEFIAAEVANEAAARGLNPERYMFGAPKQFMDDVVKRYDSEFGSPVAAQTPKDDDEDTRTTVLGARSTGGNRLLDEEPRPEDGFKALRDWQIKTGFHG